MTVAELLRSVPDDQVDGLLSEMVGRDNFVTVTKHVPVRRPGGRTILRRVCHDRGEARLLPPAALRLDQLRLLAGLKPRYLAEFFSAFGGELVSVTPNLRTTQGITYVCDSIGNMAGRPVVADFMALTENSVIPSPTDTVLAGEITVNGLQRVEASYGHAGTNTYFTLAHTWTSTGVFSTVQKGALFNQPTGGLMFLENVFTPTALQNGDQITVSWTVNV